MGQVSEAGKADGQILASMPPGMWNIAWVRDMAYAVVALTRAGHAPEAKRALEFQLGADSGKYQDYVGHPYKISITRYFGDGVEETDSNENGPNIEFDGFGLFLWTLDEYVAASGDETSLKSWWPTVSSEIGDTLVALQEPSGLIAADSSIWEVHWNGQQKHFAYTTITAANGLCRAARLAELVGDSARATSYREAGRRARDALIATLSAPDGTIAQSLEELNSGAGFLDAAAIEAVGMGLLDPSGRAARATLAAMQAKLVPPSARGFFRNDDGGWYDSQEWVFVDLRAAIAMRKMQNDARTPLLGWITAQGSENFNLISELHDAQTADYRGEMPMVGFGAGAYAIAMNDREAPEDFIPCGDYAVETGGAGGAGGAAGSGGSSSAKPEDDDGGCGCRLQPSRGSTAIGALFVLAVALLRRRRTQRSSLPTR
jgi:MYXO-CTERM domain-containing protein